MYYEFAKTLPTGLKIVLSGFSFRVRSIVTLAPPRTLLYRRATTCSTFITLAIIIFLPLVQFLIQLTRETEGLNTTQETKLKYRFSLEFFKYISYIFLSFSKCIQILYPEISSLWLQRFVEFEIQKYLSKFQSCSRIVIKNKTGRKDNKNTELDNKA